MAVFQTQTDYDLQQMEELQRVAGKTFARKQTLLRRSFSTFGGALCVGMGLLLAVRKDSVFLALACCALGTLLLVRGIFFYQMAAMASCYAMGRGAPPTRFTFERKEILSYRGLESSRYPYSSCSQLLETERSFYFIMDGGQGLLLDKEHLHGGTPDQLRAWLEEKCGLPVTWCGRKECRETSSKP